MAERITCCVPFCRRTTGEKYSEWICADHWRLTDRKTRFMYFKAKRKGKVRFAAKLWQRLKVQAIEAAGGLS